MTDEIGPCWEWQGAITTNGYGQLWLIDAHYTAHRVIYEALRGKVPDGLVLDHLCRNRACVNPWHLDVVTCKENILRGIGPPAMNARLTACHKGHEFTPENTRSYRGRRVCVICSRAGTRERMRRYEAKKRAKKGEAK